MTRKAKFASVGPAAKEPDIRPRFFSHLLARVFVAFLLVAAISAGTKEPNYDITPPTQPPGGPAFNAARGIAVNTSGVGASAGTIYVLDFNNNRVQALTADGIFIRAWGWDVVTGGSTGFEICTVASECKAGTSGGGAGQLNGAAGGLAVNQATGNVFVLDRNNNRVQVFSGTGAFLRTFGKNVSTAGGTGAEICTSAEEANCKAGESGTGAGMLNVGASNALVGIGVDSSGNVYVPDTSNARVQKFDSNGNFLAMGGWDTITNGSASDPTSISTYQVCTAAMSADCKAGVSGTGADQFASGLPSFLAVSSAGDVYAVSRTNGTIYRFSSGLTFENSFSSTAGTGATTPTRNPVAVNWTNGNLFFTKNVSPADGNIYEFNPTTQTVIDVHPTNYVGELTALAVNSSTGRMYVVRGTAATSIRVLDDPLPLPVTTVNPVTTKGATTATVSGTVDPKGGFVSCKFQFSTDLVDWTTVETPEPGCASLTPSGGAQAVSENATGLVPNTHYFVRLRAARPSGAFGVSNVVSFDTDPAPPLVSNVGAVQVEDKSARLVGTIDPRHAATAYVFEYGDTPALGSSTPPVNIGSGSVPVTISRVVSGLSPNKTYYFRLVATNVFGSVKSEPTSSFVTRIDSPPPPVERDYEQVSTFDKGFANIDDAIEANFKFTIAEDGDSVSYCNSGAGGAQIGTFCGDYISQRTSGGWLGRVIAPLACGQDLEATAPAAGGQKKLAISKNLEYAVIGQPEAASCGVDPLNPLAPMPGNNLYRQSLQLGGEPTFDLLTTRLSSAVARSFNTPNGGYVGGSDDFGHVVFRSSGDQCQPIACGLTLSATNRLFEWVAATGEVRLVSQGAGVNVNSPSSLGANPDPMTGPQGNGYGAVSATGNRIFFQSPTNFGPGVSDACTSVVTPVACELYMREGGATTYDVSQSECTSSCGSDQPDNFQWANPDGDRVLFTSQAKLVNADSFTAGSDLYIYRHSATPAADSNLTLLSIDNEPLDGTGVNVQGLLGMSDDGNVAYFVANGQLVQGASTAAGPKVYRWNWNGGNPTLQYLATLSSSSDGYIWEYSGSGNKRTLIRRTTPSGESLLLDTVVRLDQVADQDTTRDVYRWAPQGGWSCLSCQEPGVASVGDSSIKALSVPFTLQNGNTQNSDLVTVGSDDGKRVFFTSPDPLVAGDTNGASGCPSELDLTNTRLISYRCDDVYEWNDGRVSLVSTGMGGGPAKLVGSSRSGDDVFFLSSDRLVGWDTDTLYDIYDARKEPSGFGEPPIKPAPCEAEACYGPGPPAPTDPGPGTPSFQGPGDQRTCQRGYVQRGEHCVKPHKKKGHRKGKRQSKHKSNPTQKGR